MTWCYCKVHERVVLPRPVAIIVIIGELHCSLALSSSLLLLLLFLWCLVYGSGVPVRQDCRLRKEDIHLSEERRIPAQMARSARSCKLP